MRKEIKGEDISKIKEILDSLVYIKDDEISKYFLLEKITYGNLAHLYFRLGSLVNKVLSDVYQKKFFRSYKLKKRYKEIIIVEDLINNKKPDKSDPNRMEKRPAIWANKELYQSSLNHYVSAIQRIHNKWINYIIIMISVAAIVMSSITLFIR